MPTTLWNMVVLNSSAEYRWHSSGSSSPAAPREESNSNGASAKARADLFIFAGFRAATSRRLISAPYFTWRFEQLAHTTKST